MPEAGVLGAICGVIGSRQAVEVLKLITGAGDPLRGRLLAYDALAVTFHTSKFSPQPTCVACGRAPSLRSLVPENYAAACLRPLPRP